MRGLYTVVHLRKNKLHEKFVFKNLTTNEGARLFAGVVFDNIQKPSFYVGIIQSLPVPVPAVTDTMASHPNWVENFDYNETSRQQWFPDEVSTNTWSNSVVPCVFNFDRKQTLKGLFLTTDSVKNGTTGTLISAGTLTVAISILEGDSLSVTYSML